MGFSGVISSVVSIALGHATGLMGDFGPIIGVFLAVTFAGAVLSVVMALAGRN